MTDDVQRSLGSKLLRWLPMVVVVVLFGRVVTFGFVEWDDVKYLRTNPLIAGAVPGDVVNPFDYLFTPQLGYVVPVTVAIERLLYLLGGGAAWPFHLLAVLLHGVSAVLVQRIGEKLGAGEKTSLVAALLWACHPVVAEPVSWATGLKDVLAVCLLLGATLAYLRERSALAVVLGTLAFFAKPTTVLLPAALALLPKRQRGALLGLSIAAVLSGVLSFLMRRAQIAIDHGDAASTPGSGFNPIKILVAQTENYLSPLDLHPLYDITSAGTYDYFVALLVVGALVALLIKQKSEGRFAVGFALAMYLPTSQLIPFPRSMADSFVYAPSIGGWLLVALVAKQIPERRRRQLVPLPFVLLCGLALLSFRQSARWRSNESLWLPLLQDDPGWAYPHILLAQGYWAEGRPHDAAHMYGQAFARQYALPYLSAYAEALYADARYKDARCVFEEDYLFGVNQERAKRNLEKFWMLLRNEHWNGNVTSRPMKQCDALQRSIERIGAAEARE